MSNTATEPLLYRGALSGRFYVAMSYAERNGRVEVEKKHDITEQVSELLASLTVEDVPHVFALALREAADEVGAWGPACIPAAQALRARADQIDKADT